MWGGAAGDGAGALRVFDAICAETTELTDLSEFEYKFLLHVLGEQNQFEDLQRVWLHMKENLGALTPVAIRLVQQYFTKHAGVKPDGSPKWQVSTVQVDPKVCSFRGSACAVFHQPAHPRWECLRDAFPQPQRDATEQGTTVHILPLHVQDRVNMRGYCR